MIEPIYKTELGELYHGDCKVILREFRKDITKRFDLVLTDPPYGTTACAWDVVIPFNLMWSLLWGLVKPTTPILLFGSEPFSSLMRVSNLDMYRYDWVWNKNNGSNYALAKIHPLKYTENISVFSKRMHNYYPQDLVRVDKIQKRSKSGEHFGAIGDTNLQEYAGYPKNILKFNLDRTGYHPTQKPVALLEYLIKTYTKPGDLVLDFTSGSGSLAVACEKLNRRWVCIELDQNYLDATWERLMLEAGV